MPTADDIHAIMVSLDLCESPALLILLAADGGINRMGSGAEGDTERDLRIGVTRPHPFKQLRQAVDASWFDHEGSYTEPDIQGDRCKLTLTFQLVDGSETGMEFIYGSKSLGPPRDLLDFVELAVDLTDSWYRGQRRNRLSRPGNRDQRNLQ